MDSIYKKQKGFTIIELIISIFILSIAVIGIFNAFSIMTILTSDSADKLTATYLAQEGMEIVRNIRDTNWLNMDSQFCASVPLPTGCTTTWVDNLTSGSTNYSLNCTSGCEADYTTDYVAGALAQGAYPMSPLTADYLWVNKTNGLYGYNTINATVTKFKRKIVVKSVTDANNDSNHIINVTVQVSWDQKATILNPYCSAASYGTTGCNNGVTAEETLYNWYYPNH